jgi:predicted PurR-regulated permease PerM
MAPDAPSDAPTRSHAGVRGRLLAVIATILTLAALKAASTVMLPLTFAIFFIALFWPLQRRLQQRLPTGIALLLTLLTFLLTLGGLIGALWFSAELVAERGSTYFDQFQQMYESTQDWVKQYGVNLPGVGEGSTSSEQAQDALLTVSRRTFAFLGALILVIAYLVLGLLEVPDFRAKVDRATGGRGTRWFESAQRIARDFQRYIVVRTVVGLITGVLAGLACWIIGLDFAFIWGLSNFLLNYIPTIGSIIAVFPPTLFALVQFGLTWQALVVLLAVGGVQLVMGNYVDPLLQGKYLDLSPLVVLFSVAFWGWLWGIAGAFIGIPITVAIVIGCSKSDSTRWIATLLADVQEDDAEDEQG